MYPATQDPQVRLLSAATGGDLPVPAAWAEVVDGAITRGTPGMRVRTPRAGCYLVDLPDEPGLSARPFFITALDGAYARSWVVGPTQAILVALSDTPPVPGDWTPEPRAGSFRIMVL